MDNVIIVGKAEVFILAGRISDNVIQMSVNIVIIVVANVLPDVFKVYVQSVFQTAAFPKCRVVGIHSKT